jgi:hypothetical protein
MASGTAGYSATPLVRKLGIKAGMTLGLLGAPEDFADTLGELPPDVVIRHRLGGHFDLVVAFMTGRAELAGRLDDLRAAVAPTGVVWVAWPKRAGARRTGAPQTDLTEDVVREVALPLGLVDVKVCAVDEVWSGLKLVIRRSLR